MQTSLYRYFTAGGSLLYVGISHDPLKREYQHTRDKDMRRVAYIELEWFENREAAKLAEDLAIKRERPLWNKAQLAKPRKLTKSPSLKAPEKRLAPKLSPSVRPRHTRRKKSRRYHDMGPHLQQKAGPPCREYVIELAPDGQHMGISPLELCFDPDTHLDLALRVCRKGATLVTHADVKLPNSAIERLVGGGVNHIVAARLRRLRP